MSDSKTTIKTGLIVESSSTLTPNAIELAPGGAASTKTVIQPSQTADRTITLPDASTTMVGTAVTQTLTNKTIVAADNTITVAATGVVATSLNGALTEIQANVAAAGSGATAALNAHINNTTGAHAASAISVTPTGNISSTQVQAALVELQGDIDTNTANISTNATNLSNHITNPTGAHAASAISVTPSGNLSSTEAQAALVELQLDVDTRATTAALTAHTGASTGVHGVTGAVVGTTDTQTLTNKSIGAGGLTFNQITTPATPAAGTNKIYPKADGFFYTLNSSGVEVQVGSGSSSGIYPNFISNGGAENGTTGWTTYTNTAGTSPVTGSGAGATNITFTSTTSSPLSGATSFLITKAAVNAQGQGVSYDFEVDAASQAKPLKISFDYKLVSGTFTAGNPADRTSAGDSSLTVWIFDVNNNVLIQPSNYRLYSNSTGVSASFEGEFQSSSNGTIYRLIIHNGNTAATAYVLECDSFAVRRSQNVTGAAVTDWQSYVPTFTGFGTVTINEASWRKNGSDIEIRSKFVTGTHTAVEARMSLPPGLSSAVLNLQAAGGFAAPRTVASSVYVFPLIEPSVSYLTFAASDSGQLTKANGTAMINTSTFSLNAKFPIQGWSSSTLMSDSADTRVVDFSGYVLSNQSLTANTTNITLTSTKDSHGVWTGSSYVVPVSGDYLIANSLAFTATVSTSIRVYVDNTFIKEAGASFGSQRSVGSALLTGLTAGQVITFRTADNVTTLSGTAYNISIYRLSGPAQISATELIAASYYCSANQAASTTTPINYDSREFDTHGAVTTGATWRFTAPAAGTYLITSLNYVPSTNVDYTVFKNGVAYRKLGAHTSGSYSTASAPIKLIASDYIEIRPSASVSISGNASLATNNPSNISITRIGL